MNRAFVATMTAGMLMLQGCDSKGSGEPVSQGPPLIVHTSEITSLAPKDGSNEVIASKTSLKGSAMQQKANAAAARSMVNLRDLMRTLRKDGVVVSDLSEEMSPAYRRAFVDTTRAVGASEVALLGVKNSFSFIAVVFDDTKALNRLLKAPPDLVRYQNIILIPSTGMTADWENVVHTIQNNGGEQVLSRSGEAGALVEQLQRIRSAIVEFKTKEGRYPDFVARHWESMIKKLYFSKPPMNPFSPRLIADRIEIVKNPGISGDAVSKKKAGWVWNETDHKMFAAGFNDEKLEQMLLSAPGGQNYIALPEDHVRARVNQLRNALTDAKSLRSRQGKTGNPTLAEFIAQFSDERRCPQNPMNGSIDIQPGKWDAKNPAVSGGAGWNYDERAGKIWANSNLVEENKL